MSEGEAVVDESTAAGSTQTKEGYNIFRDSALRFMGYANEVGESFRYQFPRLVTPTYVLAFGYCASDAIFAGHRKWNETEVKSPVVNDSNSENVLQLSQKTKALVAAVDTLVWQTFASVLIPGGTINLIVRASRFAMVRTTLIPVGVKKWVPTGFGLGSIPFIVHPIDGFVDHVMDNTTRKWTSDYK